MLPVSASDPSASDWEADSWEEAMAEMSNLLTDLESDEPPLESDRHREQIDLLIRLLRWYWREGQALPPPITGLIIMFRGTQQFTTASTSRKRGSFVVPISLSF